MDIYAENILDHYRHPRHKERIGNPSVSHTEKNVSCGDVLTLELELHDGIIASLGWSGDGCAISQAGMSIISEELIGKTEAEAEAYTKEQVEALLGVPIGLRRMKCALLCLHTLKNTLHAAHHESTQSWKKTCEISDE